MEKDEAKMCEDCGEVLPKYDFCDECDFCTKCCTCEKDTNVVN